MLNVIKYIWQLPQNLLGLIVIKCSKAQESKGIWYTKEYFYVSLGNYIIVNKSATKRTLKHEHGHQIQSLILGPLYLIVIGLPSAIGNLLWRKFHFDYYSTYWEAWADKLGGVNR